MTIQHKKYWLGLFVASVIIMLFFAHSSAKAATHKAVYLDEKIVKPVQVGGIDAVPCPPGAVCALAVIQMKWGGEWTGGLHQVPCPHPKYMHTVRAFYGRGGHPRAVVFACRQNFNWRLA